jgi:hypothetical protein
MEQETTDNTADSPDHSQDDPLLSLFIDKTGMSARKSNSLSCFFRARHPSRRNQPR